MENSARQLTGEGSGETIMSAAASPSTAPDATSSFHTALETFHLSSFDEVALGDGSGARSSLKPKSEYFSARVEEMMRSKSQFSSDVEHEIEHSKVHWSEVSGPPHSSKGSDLPNSPEGNNYFPPTSSERSDLPNSPEGNNDFEEVDRENERVFRELMNDPQWKQHEFGDFFMEWSPLWKLGPKVAQGGQAEIFEVSIVAENENSKDENENSTDENENSKFLLKVFNRGSPLSDLRKQWPHGILRRDVVCVSTFGFKLDDGRFGFGMLKCWGDLRKLIDKSMEEKNNQGPPFPYEWSGVIWDAKHVMMRIALYMDTLHKHGIIHRDLKAANILFYENGKHLDPKTATFSDILTHRSIFVADFECSIGVVGTGFWRAPEILKALKNGTTPEFSEKTDVYGYAMTCFEIVTGRLPFEGELKVSRDLVIEGQRPKLPSDLDTTLKDLIERCWNSDPNERPSFSKIQNVFFP